MNSYPAMSVDNIDDMQHSHFEPEDAQTSHDADLFEDNDESDTGSFMDTLNQPPTSAVPVRLDIRARDEVVSEKCRFHEVDYLQTLRQTMYEQEEWINHIIHEAEVIRQEAQDNIEEQQHLAEEECERHIRDVNKKTRQWEVALKEQEQETHAQEARLRKNIAEEIARHEAEISARKDQELAEELARHEAEISVRKDQEVRRKND
ncbi:hypothetical protein EDB19DRAFT_1836270 [Suillus lakei]|nr:hypothetical protein EDB19DRAFT_1836270 [Suillus lakei]